MSGSHKSAASLSLVLETERAIAALDPPPALATHVALARHYAASIVDTSTLAMLGPKLATVMTRIDAALRRAPVRTVAAGAEPEPAEPADPELAAALAAMDELARRRRERAERAG